MTDDELAGFQDAMIEALLAGRAPSPDDPACAGHRDYVASFEPHLVEVTLRLVARWSKRAAAFVEG